MLTLGTVFLSHPLFEIFLVPILFKDSLSEPALDKKRDLQSWLNFVLTTTTGSFAEDHQALNSTWTSWAWARLLDVSPRISTAYTSSHTALLPPLFSQYNVWCSSSFRSPPTHQLQPCTSLPLSLGTFPRPQHLKLRLPTPYLKLVWL